MSNWLSVPTLYLTINLRPKYYVLSKKLPSEYAHQIISNIICIGKTINSYKIQDVLEIVISINLIFF